jgi:hypothetical protein
METNRALDEGRALFVERLDGFDGSLHRPVLSVLAHLRG